MTPGRTLFHVFARKAARTNELFCKCTVARVHARFAFASKRQIPQPKVLVSIALTDIEVLIWINCTGLIGSVATSLSISSISAVAAAATPFVIIVIGVVHFVYIVVV